MDNLNYLKKLKCCLTPPEPSRSRPVLLGPDPVVWDRILPQWVPVTQVEGQDEERCSSRSILPLQSPRWGFWPPGWLWGWWVSRPWKISKCKLGARAFLPPVSQSVSQDRTCLMCLDQYWSLDPMSILTSCRTPPRRRQALEGSGINVAFDYKGCRCDVSQAWQFSLMS